MIKPLFALPVLALAALLVLGGAVSFPHSAYAIAQGQPCTGTVNNNECDGTLACINGTCQVDPALETNPGATNPADTNPGATNPGASGAQTLQNPLKASDLPTLIKDILGAVVEIGSILLVVMLVWVGFLFVTARGNPEEISKARTALLWTVIGGLILLGAQAIADVITATVGSLQ